MKKIMFNERYGLQQAVLDRKKTMTRRIIKRRYEAVKAYHANGDWHFIADTEDGDSVELKPHYEIGERVAIAHGYEKILCEYGLPRLACDPMESNYDGLPDAYRNPAVIRAMMNSKGYRNKMFVKSYLMPHHIRITDLRGYQQRGLSKGRHQAECCRIWRKEDSTVDLFW